VKRIVLIAVLLALLVGCAGRRTLPTDADLPIQTTEMVIIKIFPTGAAVYRFKDLDAGNICYLYSGHYKGGISCLPLEE